jgi:hypothetical protein
MVHYGNGRKLERRSPGGDWVTLVEFEPGVQLNNQTTLVVEYWRCEQHRALHFNVQVECWNDLKQMIEKCGIRVVEKELKDGRGFGPTCDLHRWLEIRAAVCEVQGLPPIPEGEYGIVDAIESLVAAYAKLK